VTRRHQPTPESAYVRQIDSTLRNGGPHPLPPAASAATVIVNVRTGEAGNAASDAVKVSAGAPIAGGSADSHIAAA